MNSRNVLRPLALAIAIGSAPGATIFTSGFNGNTGATVLPGNTDNTGGSASLTITDWTTAPSVTSVSGLTAISTDDGVTIGGFAQLQNGAATYANGDTVYLSRNHNLGTAPKERGFGMTFTLGDSLDLGALTVRSGHTNNTGTSDQAYVSTLVFQLSGGSLGATVTGSSVEDYATGPAYHDVAFDLSGTTLAAGTYTLRVYQTAFSGGGAYAAFDGITLESVPEPGAAVLGILAGALVLVRRRR